MKICDIHTHILPGVDDGAATMQQALQMLNNAVASDVKAVVLTPHCNIEHVCDNYRDHALAQRFAQLQAAARHIPVQLALGAEVRADGRLLQLLQAGKIPTLNDSRYLLAELPWKWTMNQMTQMLGKIRAEGYVPLVAHPERYGAVWEDPLAVTAWLDLGCHIQLTGGSITGAYGKEAKHTAQILLQRDLVCCVASDAHDADRRSNYLMEVYSYLMLHFSKQYARILMWDNPMGICSNRAI